MTKIAITTIQMNALFLELGCFGLDTIIAATFWLPSYYLVTKALVIIHE